MKRIWLALACVLWAATAHAQIAGFRVVSNCGTTSPWPALQTSYQPFSIYLSVDTNMVLCSSSAGGGGGGTSSSFASAFPGTGTAAGFVNFADSTMSGAEVSLWGTAPTGAKVLDANVNILAGSVTANGAVNLTPTQCAGSITTGGTAQNAIGIQTTMHGFTVTNNDPTHGSGEPLWISMTAVAVQSGGTGSDPLPAPATTTLAGMGSYSSPPGFGSGHAVSVIAATTGHTFGCFWW